MIFLNKLKGDHESHRGFNMGDGELKLKAIIINKK